MQAEQALIPRQARLIPQGRSDGSARTPSQAGNPHPRNSAGNAGIHSQAGNPPKPPPLLPGRNGGSADILPQADQSLSPSQGASGATAWDGTSCPDNTSITGKQGQRSSGHTCQIPQLGQTQPVPSRVPPVRGKTP